MSTVAPLHCVKFSIRGTQGQVQDLIMVRTRAVELLDMLVDATFRQVTLTPVMQLPANIYDIFNRYAPIRLNNSCCNPTSDNCYPEDDEPFLNNIKVTLHVREDAKEMNLTRKNMPSTIDRLIKENPHFTKIVIQASAARS